MRLSISTLPFVFLMQSILAKPLTDGDAIAQRNMSLPANIKLSRALPNMTRPPLNMHNNITIPRSVPAEVSAKESNGHPDTGNPHNGSRFEDVDYKTTTVRSQPERRQDPSTNVSAEVHPDRIKSIDLTTRRALEQDTAGESMA